uniref:Uncharacterized protein n=1 Tax=Glossina austeni TaxID=7395 RepID=A0A1A9V8Y4_GLOAU
MILAATSWARRHLCALRIFVRAFASFKKNIDVTRPFQRLAIEQQSAQSIFILAGGLRSSRTQYGGETTTTPTFFTDNGVRLQTA